MKVTINACGVTTVLHKAINMHFMDVNICIMVKILLKFVPWGLIVT